MCNVIKLEKISDEHIEDALVSMSAEHINSIILESIQVISSRFGSDAAARLYSKISFNDLEKSKEIVEIILNEE